MVLGRSSIVSTLGRALRGPAVAIGNFDGVHLGHQALLAEARRVAGASGGEAVAMTFDPHPARFFAPKLAPPVLTSLDRRGELLRDAGADVVLVEPFTADLASMTAEDFIERCWVRTWAPVTLSWARTSASAKAGAATPTC